MAVPTSTRKIIDTTVGNYKFGFRSDVKNKFMSANIRTNLIYDDNIQIADKYGNKAPRVQFREVLSIGLSYTISNK